MNLEHKQAVIIGLALFLLVALSIVAWVEGGRARLVDRPEAVVSSDNADCVSCHRVKTPGIVGQWEVSQHARSGIGCVQCHTAQKGDRDGYEHEGRFIATIVSPRDCAQCHKQEADEFEASHHSTAGQILGSLDNVLAEVVEGHTVLDLSLIHI